MCPGLANIIMTAGRFELSGIGLVLAIWSVHVSSSHASTKPRAKLTQNGCNCSTSTAVGKP